jgi:hypothetical protein
MSAEIPPDPITNSFNPAAWNVPELTDEERALLDANYIKFPIAQNSPIVFPSSISAPTQVNTDNSTKVATTAWGNLFWNYVRSLANTWTGTQTFSGTITSATIAPTTSGGTLNIGNAAANVIFIAGTASRTAILNIGNGNSSAGEINIGNGLASSNPVNILYSSTDAGASGEINLGSATGTINLRCPLTPTSLTYPLASTQIGYSQSVSPLPVAYPTLNADVVLASLTLAAGVWLLVGEAGLDRSSGNVITAGFNTTTTITSSARGVISMNYSGSAAVLPTLTVNCVLSINASTTYNFIGRSSLAISPSYSFNGIVFSATRLA